MLELDGLEKSWPDFRISLGLGLARGRVAAVLGPSGCGKSTLLRLIAGLEAPDAGRILVGGADVTRVPPERRGVGLVFQDFALFPHLSVRRNIEYGPRMRGADRAERRRAAEAVAESFEISSLLERSTYSLSGGERQRVALARAMAARPSVLLLDEPLSSLDASLRRRLRGEIARRLKEAGMTAVLVTHDAEEALEVADRIFIMREGRIEAEGEGEALYSSPPTAWSASFLDRGPLLEVLALEGGRGRPIALTPLGPFACRPLPEGARATLPMSLFFPASAPRPAPPGAVSGRDVARNRISGRVEASRLAGSLRRLSLSCPLAAGDAGGGARARELSLEIELPSSPRAEIGEILELEVDADLCLLLPGAVS